MDYEKMNRAHRRQKAALTRAINSGDFRKVKLACQAAVREWNEAGMWPDDWSRWQRALDDAFFKARADGWGFREGFSPRLEELG